MENKEQINLVNFEKCKHIKLEDVGKFLQSQGYNWTGFINENVTGEYEIDEFNNINALFHFEKPTEKSFRAYNYFLIWTGNSFKESFTANCNNNKFVRYIYFNVSEFKVSIIFAEENSKCLTTKLEKNLSKEWVQFIAKQKEDYSKNLITLCTKRTAKAKEELENSKRYVEIEKIKLDKYLQEKTASTIKELYSLDETTRWIGDIDQN